MEAARWERNVVERVAVGDMSTRAARRFRQRVGVVDRGRSWTFEEFNEAAERTAAGLLAAGLGPQEPVGILAGNSYELLVTYFACAKAGLIACPLNTRLGRQLATCLSDAAIQTVVAEAEYAPLLQEMGGGGPRLKQVYWVGEEWPDSLPGVEAKAFTDLMTSGSRDAVDHILIDDRDPVQLLFTSGTTGRPKGVLTSHLAVTLTALAANTAMMETVQADFQA